MADIETVITHLQIIHTWAAFARKRDLQFFTAKHLEDIAQWSDDAINLLNEQEAVEPKTGHWFKIHGGTAAQCTICKCWGQIRMKFCPWCGAKMET